VKKNEGLDFCPSPFGSDLLTIANLEPFMPAKWNSRALFLKASYCPVHELVHAVEIREGQIHEP
jgi:hypothetical protein